MSMKGENRKQFVKKIAALENQTKDDDFVSLLVALLDQCPVRMWFGLCVLCMPCTFIYTLLQCIYKYMYILPQREPQTRFHTHTIQSHTSHHTSIRFAASSFFSSTTTTSAIPVAAIFFSAVQPTIIIILKNDLSIIIAANSLCIVSSFLGQTKDWNKTMNKKKETEKRKKKERLREKYYEHICLWCDCGECECECIGTDFSVQLKPFGWFANKKMDVPFESWFLTYTLLYYQPLDEVIFFLELNRGVLFETRDAGQSAYHSLFSCCSCSFACSVHFLFIIHEQCVCIWICFHWDAVEWNLWIGLGNYLGNGIV